MNLFEKLRDMLGCEFISDIRNGASLKSAKQIVALLDLSLYPTEELRDMAEYLYGEDCTDLRKEEVISFLKGAKED